jgi:CspA family cold shock protein
MQGKVVWFSNARGFGFLKPDSAGKDVFVHYSAIVGDGYKQLKADQRVAFEIVQGQNGPQAADVEVIGE